MSHPIHRAHLTASKGGSSVPLFPSPLQSTPSLTHLLSSLTSLLPSLSMIWRRGIHQEPYTESGWLLITSSVSINTLNYLNRHSVYHLLTHSPVYSWDRRPLAIIILLLKSHRHWKILLKTILLHYFDFLVYNCIINTENNSKWEERILLFYVVGTIHSPASNYQPMLSISSFNPIPLTQQASLRVRYLQPSVLQFLSFFFCHNF